jgi:hypothetical protein
MKVTQSSNALRADVFNSRFPQKLICEQASAHANPAVNAPNRQFETFGVQRFLPREHMLIDAVDESPVEIEQEHRINAHC